jgi:hypothetical protein
MKSLKALGVILKQKEKKMESLKTIKNLMLIFLTTLSIYLISMYFTVFSFLYLAQ